MPDLFDILVRWWKRILAVVLLSVLTTGVISFLKPKKYLSVATALPASSYASDKAKIFNDNIQELYTALGTPDDLDAVTGIAALDTVYIAVAVQFNLYDHYKTTEKGAAAVQKAAWCLKKNTKVYKSEYGNLKVKVWDTDKNLAAQLANAVMETLNNIQTGAQNENNIAALNNLKANRHKLSIEADSLTASLNYDSANGLKISRIVTNEEKRSKTTRRNIILEQLIQYEKLINQYQLMADSKTSALIVIEKAKASNWPDKPKTLQMIIATAVLSFLFGLLAALYLESRKNNKA